MVKGGYGQTDLDSHADTCVAGSNCVMDQETGDTATVHAFSDERKPFMKVPIATCLTAWTSPKTGETFVLELHQALYFGNKLGKTLLCPNQLKDNGLTPKHSQKVITTIPNNACKSLTKQNRSIAQNNEQ